MLDIWSICHFSTSAFTWTKSKYCFSYIFNIVREKLYCFLLMKEIEIFFYYLVEIKKILNAHLIPEKYWRVFQLFWKLRRIKWATDICSFWCFFRKRRPLYVYKIPINIKKACIMSQFSFDLNPYLINFLILICLPVCWGLLSEIKWFRSEGTVNLKYSTLHEDNKPYYSSYFFVDVLNFTEKDRPQGPPRTDLTCHFVMLIHKRTDHSTGLQVVN